MFYKFIEYLSPEEVFEIWRQNEENLDHWKEFYQSQGYSSWEEWRRPHFNRFQGYTLEWYKCQVMSPSTVLGFRGGPFRGWKENYYGPYAMPRFETLVENLKVSQQPYIRELSENFPKETTMTGLLTNNGETIYVIEGMHRCAAIAVAMRENREIESNIYFALADFPSQQIQDMYRSIK